MKAAPKSHITFVCFVLLFTLSLVFAVPQVGQAAAPLVLPAGFSDELVVDGLLAPRAFAFAPDGRIFVLERGSATSSDINLASVRIFKDGLLLPERALTLELCGDGERGLLGIALDPAFASNGYIYLYYTRAGIGAGGCGYNTYMNGNQPGPRNRISRFTLVGDVVQLGSEKVLVDNIVSDVGVHNGGDLHFGADGYLYAATGEGGIASLSPDLATLNGKMLRILPTDADPRGYVTTGNPYDAAVGARYCGALPAPQGSGPCREIFAYGLRNPFRFTMQPIMPGIPGAGLPVVGDVGGGAWEEIDQIVAGGNYGYPTREGPCSGGVICSPPFEPSGFNDPIYAYPHVVVYANFDSAVIGGAFYTGSSGAVSYPSEYLNNYFFAEFARGFIRRLRYDTLSAAWVAVEPDFATGGAGIIGLKAGLGGSLYYMTYTSDSERSGQIRHIVYTGSANQTPFAQLSVSPQGGVLESVFTFSASGSSDPDGNLPLTYNWDFGDGTTATSSTPTIEHTYQTAGKRQVILTVTDSGTPASTSPPASVTVYPGNLPPAGEIVVTNLTNVTRGTNYYAGDTFAVAVANATDDQPLPADAFSWEIVFHHREHTHPFLSSVAGATTQFTVPTTGELDPLVWYRIKLHIRDAEGQTTTLQQDIVPQTITTTLATNPPGGLVTVEGAVFPSPYTMTRVIGMQTVIDVPSPQVIGGSHYAFASWSQGGSKTQTIVIPPLATTYTANLEQFIPSATPTETPTATPTSTPTPILGDQTLTAQITSGADDVNQDTNDLNVSGTILWVGNSGPANPAITGLRFNNMMIPRGAIIRSAQLELYSTTSQWLSISLQIAAEAADQSAAFTPLNPPGLRPLTTAVTSNSNTLWDANAWYVVDNLAGVIQEVTNRPGWQTGNSLSIVIQGTSLGSWGRKFVSAFEGSPATAPRLMVEFVVPLPTVTPTATSTLTPSPTSSLTATATPITTIPPTLTALQPATLVPSTPLSPKTTFVPSPIDTATAAPASPVIPTETPLPTSLPPSTEAASPPPEASATSTAPP